jgi:Fic family protein
MTPRQLPLFDLDTLEVSCPHCGHRFDAVKALADERRVLEHPQVALLPEPTQQFLRESPREFLLGGQVGVAQLHRWTGLSKAGVHHQLALLVRRGVAQAIPKRPGGKYCQYRLALNVN